jgi:hypothetical protein
MVKSKEGMTIEDMKRRPTHSKVLTKEEIREIIGLWTFWKHCGNLTKILEF